MLFKSLVQLLSYRTQHNWVFATGAVDLRILGEDAPESAQSKPPANVLWVGHSQQHHSPFLHLPIHANELELRRKNPALRHTRPEKIRLHVDILSKGALGLIMLMDNSRPDPLDDLDMYLDGFASLISRTACVVGVGKTEHHAHPDLDGFAARMQARGFLNPVVATDVRDPQQVLQLLDLLLLQLEH
ncbi:MAG: hypothetical protein M3R45_07745 [Pseudomonadota bacterium]|nr:hypothetical protein [Pseudomonadota bacterium]